MASKAHVSSQGQGGSKQVSQQQSKQKTSSGQPPLKKDKRTLSDVSNESVNTLEISTIQTQLDDIAGDLGELKIGLDNVMKKDEIESLITSTITNVMLEMEKRLKKDIDRAIREKTKDLQDRIDSLEFDNKQLSDSLKKTQEDTVKRHKEIEEKQKENEQRAMEANRRANYNEQYSRKNNIKITNVKQDAGEDAEKLQTKVNEILDKHGLKLDSREIIAIHRIPSRKTDIKPILIKTINNDVKTKVMRKRKELKEDGHKVIDDVTSLNTGDRKSVV